MKTIYLSLEKNGKELVDEFTTEERALAHQYVGRFYLGSVETTEVSDESFAKMEKDEKENDDGAHIYGERTDLEIYID